MFAKNWVKDNPVFISVRKKKSQWSPVWRLIELKRKKVWKNSKREPNIGISSLSLLCDVAYSAKTKL